MKSEEFIDIIGDIEEEYLIKAHEERKIKKVIPMKKVFALVAALILIAATATVVIAEVFNIKFDDSQNVQLYDYKTGEKIEHTRYNILYEAEKIEISEFGEEIKENHKKLEEAEELHHDCKIGEECTEHGPLSYSKDFSVLSEAVDYIGSGRITLPEMNFRTTDISVSQTLNFISLYYYCESKEIDFTVHARIEMEVEKRWTDGVPKMSIVSIGEETEYYEEYRTNANGIEYVVVYKEPKDRYFNAAYDRNLRVISTSVAAYIAKNGVLYSYNDTIRELYNEDSSEVDERSMSNIRKDEKEVVEKYLKLWADSF
ncbi:MAG: hypothetical protein IKJ82_06845 [Oscillospiraceae bacterium]|nr:hypothetical protein [Oscillospiraceae bacterium]